MPNGKSRDGQGAWDRITGRVSAPSRGRPRSSSRFVRERGFGPDLQFLLGQGRRQRRGSRMPPSCPTPASPGSRRSARGQLNDAAQRIRETGLFQSVDVVPQGGTLVIQVDRVPDPRPHQFRRQQPPLRRGAWRPRRLDRTAHLFARPGRSRTQPRSPRPTPSAAGSTPPSARSSSRATATASTWSSRSSRAACPRSSGSRSSATGRSRTGGCAARSRPSRRASCAR